jgi:hypothetical protein
MHRLELASVACCLALLAAPVAPAAAEDLTIIYNVTGPKPLMGGSVTRTATLWMSSGMLRHADETGDRTFELATGRIIEIDHQKKQYSESTPDERERAMQALSEEVRASVEAGKQSLEKMRRDSAEIAKVLGPKAQEQLEKQLQSATESLAKTQQELAKLAPAQGTNTFLPSMSGISTTARKGTGKRRIAGYDCEQYFLTYAGALKDMKLPELEQWVAPALEPPIAAKALKEFAFVPPPDASRGFPLALIFKDTGGGTAFAMSMEATEVKKGPIDPASFAVPPGYAKVASRMAK